MATPAEKQIAGFLAKFAPEMAAQIRSVRTALRKRLPGAVEMVYDNYNFLVFGFGPSERPSKAIFSLAAQASGTSLCFLQGVNLPDPQKVLRGTGSKVRSVRLASARDLEKPAVRALIAAALDRADEPIDPLAKRQMIVKSVSAKQRPRRRKPKP